MESWWQEVQTHSLRDQVSLPYVLWKQALPVTALDPKLWHKGYFLHHPHRWHPPGDNRNRLTVRLRTLLWLLGRMLRHRLSC